MMEVDDTKPETGAAAPAAAGVVERGPARVDENDAAAQTTGPPRVSTLESNDVVSNDVVSNDIATDDVVTHEAIDSHDTKSDSSPAPLILQSDLGMSGKAQYHVAELLLYHDRHFIESVYRAILKRAPSDAERERELPELRGGRASKVEIIERLLSSPEVQAGAGRRVRVEGLPSPVVRRLSRVPVLGYVLRLGRVLMRLPVLVQHQQQFEIYALAQQQLIADHVNQALQRAFESAASQRAIESATSQPVIDQSQTEDVIEAVAMFSEALLDLSNSHANLQAQTGIQAEQVEAALTDLTQAITLANAQQEFLVQEQRVIVETQKVVLAELRGDLSELSERQKRERAELDAELRRLQTLLDATPPPPPENSSDQA